MIVINMCFTCQFSGSRFWVSGFGLIPPASIMTRGSADCTIDVSACTTHLFCSGTVSGFGIRISGTGFRVEG